MKSEHVVLTRSGGPPHSVAASDSPACSETSNRACLPLTMMYLHPFRDGFVHVWSFNGCRCETDPRLNFKYVGGRE
jgi:hypothetical protein